jgi:hypothetical protein
MIIELSESDLLDALLKTGLDKFIIKGSGHTYINPLKISHHLLIIVGTLYHLREYRGNL